MKKNIKYLIILFAVLMVLGGGAAVLMLMPPAESSSSSAAPSSSAATESLTKREAGEVASIQVKNTASAYELVPMAEQAAASSAAASSAASSAATETVNFTVKGLESYPLQTSSVTAAASSVLQVNASKNMGAQTDLEPYGLTGDGQCKLVITYQDGSADTLVVGSKAGESAGNYVLKDGVVYISSSVSAALLSSELKFVDTAVYTVADLATEATESTAANAMGTQSSDILYSMKLSGTNFPKPVEIVYTEERLSAYVMQSPVLAESGSTKFLEMVTGLKSLTADSVAAVGVTEDKLAEYGLSEPLAQLDFNLNGEEHSLKVSASPEDGSYYLMADGRDIVYQVAAAKVDAWAKASLMDLRSSYVWLPNIMEVSKLTLTAGGTESVFNVTRTVDEEKSTETNTSYTLTIAKADGSAIAYENYQSYYKKLISLAVLSTEEVAYGTVPDFKVQYEYFEGGNTDVIEFYAIEGQDRYATVLNGTYSGLVRRAELDKLIADIATVNADKLVE